VVEEFLEGEEASFFALLDGSTCLALASAQVLLVVPVLSKTCNRTCLPVTLSIKDLEALGPDKANLLFKNMGR